MAVHGIGNQQGGMLPDEAATVLAERWSGKLAAGYRDAGLTGAPPRIVAAYYAHLVDDMAQGSTSDVDRLTPAEKEWAWAWLRELGVPEPVAQGPLTRPLRQGLDWLARRRGTGAEVLGRIMVALLREVYVYMTRPAVRERCQAVVVEALRTSGARVVAAHSLGSVVAYEALCANPDLDVDLLVTLGSPLGLPGAVFDGLMPEPSGGRAHRPASVRRWVNLADPGDLVAVPARLGDKFPVDQHAEAYIGAGDFHTFGGYLASGLTAAALAPYTDPLPPPVASGA